MTEPLSFELSRPAVDAPRLPDAEVDAPGPSDALPPELLRALPSVEGVAQEDGRCRLTVREVHRTIPALLKALSDHGAAFSQLTTHHATLEDVFVSLTGRTLRDA
jgi:hypothetical protein